MPWAKNSVGIVGDDIGLPDVTSADNGKTMEVEDGEWKLKEGSGGSGIPAPEDPSDGDVLTYDGTTSSWVAEAPSGGGGGVGMVYTGTFVYDYADETVTITVHHGGPTALEATVNDLRTDLQNGPVYLKMDGVVTNFDHSDPSAPYDVFMYAMVPLTLENITEGLGSSATDKYSVKGYGMQWGAMISDEFNTLSDNIVLTMYLNQT